MESESSLLLKRVGNEFLVRVSLDSRASLELSLRVSGEADCCPYFVKSWRGAVSGSFGKFWRSEGLSRGFRDTVESTPFEMLVDNASLSKSRYERAKRTFFTVDRGPDASILTIAERSTLEAMGPWPFSGGFSLMSSVSLDELRALKLVGFGFGDLTSTGVCVFLFFG